MKKFPNGHTVSMIRVRLAQMDQSQRWLAGEIGISANSLSSKMQCRTDFTLNELVGIAHTVGMDATALLPRKKEEVA